MLKAIETNVEAAYGRLGLTRVSDGEFEREFERHFGDLPSGPG